MSTATLTWDLSMSAGQAMTAGVEVHQLILSCNIENSANVQSTRTKNSLHQEEQATIAPIFLMILLTRSRLVINDIYSQRSPDYYAMIVDGPQMTVAIISMFSMLTRSSLVSIYFISIVPRSHNMTCNGKKTSCSQGVLSVGLALVM